MKDKVKSYIKKEYDGDNFSARYAIDRGYGIIMRFALNELDDTEGLGDWWDDEMLPKFRKYEGV